MSHDQKETMQQIADTYTLVIDQLNSAAYEACLGAGREDLYKKIMTLSLQMIQAAAVIDAARHILPEFDQFMRAQLEQDFRFPQGKDVLH